MMEPDGKSPAPSSPAATSGLAPSGRVVNPGTRLHMEIVKQG